MTLYISGGVFMAWRVAARAWVLVITLQLTLRLTPWLTLYGMAHLCGLGWLSRAAAQTCGG